tara:strand:+ start:167 stop:394 length:228 start_codon:yes stop_codon:yes gene_type:complete
MKKSELKSIIKEELTFQDKIKMMDGMAHESKLRSMLEYAIDLFWEYKDEGLEGVSNGDIIDYLKLKVESAIGEQS